MTDTFNSNQPLIIAHRGASGQATENTLPAFQLAFEIGADGIEFDIQITKDGKLVVFHDETVNRLTDGTGSIRSKSLAEIKSLNIKNHFNSDQLFIPTLDEVLSIVPRQVIVNIEIKGDSLFQTDITQKLQSTLIHFPDPDRVIISSFNILQLFRAKRLMPGFKRGLLCAPGISPTFYQRFFRKLIAHFSLHPYEKDLSPGLIALCHQQKTRVYSYTVNELKKLHDFMQYNIDGIFTDHPFEMIEYRDRISTDGKLHS